MAIKIGEYESNIEPGNIVPVEIPSTDQPVKIIGSASSNIPEIPIEPGGDAEYKVKATSGDLNPYYLSGKVDDITIEVSANKLQIKAGGHTIASHDTDATGAQLDTLTDGSNADLLHSHSLIAGFEDDPTNGELSKGPTSNWAYDHANNGHADEKHLSDTQYAALHDIYTHPTGDGNLHVPANSTTNNGKFLMASAVAGVYTWEETGGINTLDGVYDYVTLAGGVLTRHQIDLATDVQGILPTTQVANLSGVNTGDQDLSAYSLVTHTHSGYALDPHTHDDLYMDINEDVLRISDYLGTGGDYGSSDAPARADHDHSGYSPIKINIDSGANIGVRTGSLIEGTDYPTGWTVDEGSTTDNLKITHDQAAYLFKAEWVELNPDPQTGAEYQHLDAAFAWGVIYENSGKTTIEFTNFAPSGKEGFLSLTFHN